MKRRGRLVLALALGSMPALSTASGGAAVSHAGLRVRLGPPPAAHAMPGGDALRSHRAHSVLGKAPHVASRLRVAYGVGRGLVTDPDGGFFVLHPTARASRFDAQGKLLHSLKLEAEPASPPVVTSNGSVAFVVAGELQRVDAGGRVRSRTLLGEPDPTVRSILASRDGSVVVASNSWLVKVSALGDVVWQKSVPETPLELIEAPGGLWCVTAPGSLYRFDASGNMSRVGELGGPAQAVSASPDGHELLSRSGNHRLVSFDLLEHRLRLAIEDPTLELDGPVLLGRAGQLQAFTSDGLLVRYHADGSEAERVPIDPGARKAPGDADALLLSDGRLLVARSGADVVLVGANGEVSTVVGSACPDPVGLFGAGAQGVLLACRSGNMLRIQ